ncbi:MAG: hypothetical protein M1836_003607 [Candelina mexicana]|nr:MAG: hypothetical protein M1836_003607 [Candelina mexicana]
MLKDITIITSRQFANLTINDNTQTFVVYITEIENRELISNVFFKQKINELSEHDNQDHKIKLDKSKLNFESLYNLFISELTVLCEYINKNLEKDFIQ